MSEQRMKFKDQQDLNELQQTVGDELEKFIIALQEDTTINNSPDKKQANVQTAKSSSWNRNLQDEFGRVDEFEDNAYDSFD